MCLWLRRVRISGAGRRRPRGRSGLWRTSWGRRAVRALGSPQSPGWSGPAGWSGSRPRSRSDTDVGSACGCTIDPPARFLQINWYHLFKWFASWCCERDAYAPLKLDGCALRSRRERTGCSTNSREGTKWTMWTFVYRRKKKSKFQSLKSKIKINMS